MSLIASSPKIHTETARPGGGRILTVFMICFLLGGLGCGAYFAYAHWEEVEGRFQQIISGGQQTPSKPSIISKLFKRGRSITLLGTGSGGEALINDKLLPVGAIINGIKIVEINNLFIVIEYEGTQKQIKMGESFDPNACNCDLELSGCHC